MGRQTQPGAAVLFTGKGAQHRADLRADRLSGALIQARDGNQVAAGQAVQVTAGIVAGAILAVRVALLSGWQGRQVSADRLEIGKLARSRRRRRPVVRCKNRTRPAPAARHTPACAGSCPSTPGQSGPHSAGSLAGARPPVAGGALARATMARPVTPVISETTWVNCTFNCCNAFCMCWMCAARCSISPARWRKNAREATISPSGRNAACSKPTLCRPCSHWQSWMSLLCPARSSRGGHSPRTPSSPELRRSRTLGSSTRPSIPGRPCPRRRLSTNPPGPADPG